MEILIFHLCVDALVGFKEFDHIHERGCNVNYPCDEFTEVADFVSTPSQTVFSDQDICGANAAFTDSLQNGTDSEQNVFNFTNEGELKYACRYKAGYDLFDARYEVWLQDNHPEADNRASAYDSNPVEFIIKFISIT